MSLPGGEPPLPAAPPPGEATVNRLAPRSGNARHERLGDWHRRRSGHRPPRQSAACASTPSVPPAPSVSVTAEPRRDVSRPPAAERNSWPQPASREPAPGTLVAAEDCALKTIRLFPRPPPRRWPSCRPRPTTQPHRPRRAFTRPHARAAKRRVGGDPRFRPGTRSCSAVPASETYSELPLSPGDLGTSRLASRFSPAPRGLPSRTLPRTEQAARRWPRRPAGLAGGRWRRGRALRERVSEFVERSAKASRDHLRRVGAVADTSVRDRTSRRSKSRSFRLILTVPAESTRSPVGSSRLPVMARRSLRRSMACTPVVGSLTAGDSARIAVSTSCRKPNAGSARKYAPRMRKNLGDIAVLKGPAAVHERDGGAVGQVVARSYGQLEPALPLPTQSGQTVQVSGGDNAGCTGVADAMWRGIRPRRLDLNVGRRFYGKVRQDGSPGLGGNRFEQVLDTHEPHHAIQVGDEPGTPSPGSNASKVPTRTPQGRTASPTRTKPGCWPRRTVRRRR